MQGDYTTWVPPCNFGAAIVLFDSQTATLAGMMAQQFVNCYEIDTIICSVQALSRSSEVIKSDEIPGRYLQLMVTGTRGNCGKLRTGKFHVDE